MNTCRRPVVVRRRRAEPPASGAGVSASANCLLQVWALGCAALPCHVRPPVLTVAGAAGADQRRYGLDRCHASVARTLGRRARAAAWREGPRMSMASARARPAPCAVPVRPGRYTICTEPLQIFPHDPLNWIPNICIRTSRLG